MLVLGRRPGQALVVDGPCRLVVTQVRGQLVSVGIEAPQSTRVRREELTPTMNLEAPTVAREGVTS
jgi:carbon storage regulator